MQRSKGRRPLLARAVVALAIVGTLGAVVAAPARADDHHHDRHYDRHDDHRRVIVRRHRSPVRVVPGPVYAPPPVVYAPPPQPPGLNLIFPINIR